LPVREDNIGGALESTKPISVVNRRRRATPVMTSTFENVSDIGVCLGLCLAPPANAGVRLKTGCSSLTKIPTVPIGKDFRLGYGFNGRIRVERVKSTPRSHLAFREANLARGTIRPNTAPTGAVEFSEIRIVVFCSEWAMKLIIPASPTFLRNIRRSVRLNCSIESL
jgi:hypothetical protein